MEPHVAITSCSGRKWGEEKERGKVREGGKEGEGERDR